MHTGLAAGPFDEQAYKYETTNPLMLIMKGPSVTESTIPVPLLPLVLLYLSSWPPCQIDDRDSGRVLLTMPGQGARV